MQEKNKLGQNSKDEKSSFRPGQPGTPFAPPPGTRPTGGCRRWVDCVDGFWNNLRCTGGRYCRGGWEGDDNKAGEIEENHEQSTKEEKSSFRPGQPGTPFAPPPGTRPTGGCRRWVDCVDGFWNNLRCTGGRYCRGGWEGDDNKAGEIEENQVQSTKEEKSSFRPGQPGTPFAPPPGTRPTGGCRRWVDCVDGFWNNLRCTGGRYCRGGWEGDDNKAGEIEENHEQSTKEEKSSFRPGQPGTPFAPPPGTRPTGGCRRWVDCVDGFWNNLRCTGGRYCRGGWEGDDNKAGEIEENQVQSTKEEKSSFRPGQPGTPFAPPPGTRPTGGCRRWVDCVDGFWNNLRCTGGRYCRGGWEGDDNKAGEIEENHEQSTKEEKSSFRPGQPGTPFAPPPGTRPTGGCRRWVDCVDGFWNNLRCTGGRYCRGGWEGDDNKAGEIEENHEQSTKEEKSSFRPGQPGTPFAPPPGTRPTGGCRRWVDCVDGFWNNLRCTGGRYCRGGWEGDDNKAGEIEENHEQSTKEEKSSFRPGQPGTPFAPPPGTRPTGGCRRWVNCVDGFWNNLRCTGGRYCRGGWEGDDNKAGEIEENHNQSTKEEKSIFLP